MTDRYYSAVAQLPQPWAARLGAVSPPQAAEITEVRLRSGCPAAVTKRGEALFVADGGALTPPRSGLPMLSHSALQECFLCLCRYSAFSYEAQLRRGYFTLPGGHRVGVAAQAAWDGDKLLQPKNITSLNIRIARPLPLAEPEAWRQLLAAPRPRVLIAGPPGSGKTTVLRALAQLLSAQGRRVAVLDERCELFPVAGDGFCFAQPWNCDVLSGWPKAVGMEQALRALSPEVFLCDELGSGEAAGLLDSLNSGVGFVATIHADTWQELTAKTQMRLLLQANGVRRAVFLCGEGLPGRIREQRCVDA